MVLIQCRIVARVDCAAGKHKWDIQHPTSNIQRPTLKWGVIGYQLSVIGVQSAASTKPRLISLSVDFT